jgi:hypothetical protein
MRELREHPGFAAEALHRPVGREIQYFQSDAAARLVIRREENGPHSAAAERTLHDEAFRDDLTSSHRSIGSNERHGAVQRQARNLQHLPSNALPSNRFSAMLSVKHLSAAILVSLAVSSCFSSARRISFAGEGAKETVVELDSGDIRFAAYFEGYYTGRAVGRYDIELLQANRVVSHATCDLLPIVDDRQCIFRFNKERECNVVMNCSAHLDDGGPTVVRARLSIPTKPADFKLERTDLIVGH